MPWLQIGGRLLLPLVDVNRNIRRGSDYLITSRGNQPASEFHDAMFSCGWAFWQARHSSASGDPTSLIKHWLLFDLPPIIWRYGSLIRPGRWTEPSAAH
jgi:hypothetical protein